MASSELPWIFQILSRLPRTHTYRKRDSRFFSVCNLFDVCRAELLICLRFLIFVSLTTNSWYAVLWRSCTNRSAANVWTEKSRQLSQKHFRKMTTTAKIRGYGATLFRNSLRFRLHLTLRPVTPPTTFPRSSPGFEQLELESAKVVPYNLKH